MSHDGDCVVVIGKESVGKSQLIESLTGHSTYSSNFRGATLSCQTYASERLNFVDTPGILLGSDSVTTRLALAKLHERDNVLFVVRGTHIDSDLNDLLPMARGKRGAVVVTFWDKLRQDPAAPRALEDLRRASGLAFVPVDSRHLTPEDRRQIQTALESAATIGECPAVRAGWQIEPPRTLLDHRWIGPLLALALLAMPSMFVVWCANTFAAWIDPPVQAMMTAVVSALAGTPEPFAAVLTGRYGIVTMGPLLFVWSVPTVLLFALLLGLYKATGLIDRITTAIHPAMRWCGLTGRDLIRIVMGFGCNVPAVISTRACSSGTRGTCISAIAFGSACSYQLGATLAVFAAAGRSGLVLPYLTFLVASTLIYTRLSAPREMRNQLVLLREGRAFLEWPRPLKVWHEARGTVRQFFGLAIPVFLIITVVASVADWAGVIERMAAVIAPVLGLFHLPADAALPIVFASVRKDGILLFAEPRLAASLSPWQLLTGVYLAGVLLPCLVTAITIGREQPPRFVMRLLGRQAAAALAFSLILAWIGVAFGA